MIDDRVAQQGNDVNSDVDDLVQSLKAISLIDSSCKKELKLEIIYYYNDFGSIRSFAEIRVGLDKCYIVKNMKEFLNAVENNEVLEFGKNFCYNPFNQRFTEEDFKIIEIFREINEINGEHNYQYSSYGGGSSLIAGRRIALPDKQFIKMLKLMKNKSLDVVINQTEYNFVPIIEEPLQLKIKVEVENENMIITHSEEMPLALDKSCRALWSNKSIYILPENYLRLYAPFYKSACRNGGKIELGRVKPEEIGLYILPALKKICKVIDVNNELPIKFYEKTLSIQIYLDKVNDALTAKVDFKYGDIYVNPLNDYIQERKNEILIRDMNREEEVEAIIKDLGFERGYECFVMNSEDHIINFLTEGINRLQKIAEIYYSDSFKYVKIYNKSFGRIGVQAKSEDLLEFSFGFEGAEKNELKEILNAIREKKKYFRLKNGGFISLDQRQIKDMADLVSYLNIKDSDLLKEKVILNKYNSFYIEQYIKERNMDYIMRDKSFESFIENAQCLKVMEISLPEHLQKIMRDYQKDGFKWLKRLSKLGLGGILADEMGLGKTLQAIAFLHTEKGERASLIVAPTSLIFNWEREIQKFSPDLRVLVVSGSKKRREEFINDANSCDVIITSYALLRRDIEDYRTIDFNYFILDEAQQIKNPKSVNAEVVKQIRAKGCFALTGTPLENTLGELWSIFDFILPGYLMSYRKFTRYYETPIVKCNDRNALEELNRHIKPFILRRLKKDVITELPPKIEHKLIIQMTEEQKRLYMAYAASSRDEISYEIRNNGFNKSKLRILTAITRLRQICCDPTMFIDGFEGESGKILALEELIEDSIGEGHRILIFSQFTSALKNIGSRLGSKNIDYMYLDGKTKSEDRLQAVEAYNNGKTQVFLISLKAGGTGLNLTGADLVIHFDPWWNPSVEEQAAARTHRIGQKNTVHVIKLITYGTIEEKIIRLQEKKREIIGNIMNDNLNNHDVLAQITEEELREILSL